jgi:heme/copper-type cytochrome/quinol oxidase subunit 3
MSATTPVVSAHGRAAPAPKRWSNGFLGVVFFLCSEAALFGSLIFAYLYLRRANPVWPPYIPGTSIREQHLEIGYPIINTIVLISSGVTQHFAFGALRRGQRSRYLLLQVVTIFLGTWFIGGQIYEYHGLPFSLGRDAFGATFFTLTGLHGFHVTIGILFLIWLLIGTLRGKYTQYSHFPIEAGTLYWHFVDAVWVILFSLFYLL